jgi:hypothetical protein
MRGLRARGWVPQASGAVRYHAGQALCGTTRVRRCVVPCGSGAARYHAGQALCCTMRGSAAPAAHPPAANNRQAAAHHHTSPHAPPPRPKPRTCAAARVAQAQRVNDRRAARILRRRQYLVQPSEAGQGHRARHRVAGAWRLPCIERRRLCQRAQVRGQQAQPLLHLQAAAGGRASRPAAGQSAAGGNSRRAGRSARPGEAGAPTQDPSPLPRNPEPTAAPASDPCPQPCAAPARHTA